MAVVNFFIRAVRLTIGFLFLGALVFMWISYGQESGAFDFDQLTALPSNGALIAVGLMAAIIGGACVLDSRERRGRDITLACIVWGIGAACVVRIVRQHSAPATEAEYWWFLTGLPVIFLAGFQVYSWILVWRGERGPGRDQRIVPGREVGKPSGQGRRS